MFSQHLKIDQHIRKRLFIGLLALSLAILISILFLAWWIVARQGLLLNKVILTVIVAVIICFFLVLCLGLAALVWSIWHAKTIPSLENVMYTATNVLFPFALQFGKWLGVDEDKIKNSYIQVCNQLVKTAVKSQPKKRILILAPHCLQWVECPHKITIDVNNCRECGKCQVASLLRIARQYQVNLVVATGGTFARKFIKEYRPEAVVAIACERDLTSGLQDTAGLPVIGVVNQRPEGPCSNTLVDLSKVEEAIHFFQQGG